MRRFKPKQKKVSPDPVYKNIMVTKLVGRAMKDGKKTVAQSQIYKAFDIVRQKTKEDPMMVFEKALENIRPTMEVRPRRIGGAAYQVPMSVRGPRRDSLAIRWLVQNSRLLSNSEFHTYAEKLASEIVNAAKGEGATVKKKADVEKMAEANRAFAHFRW
ncbi:30S ribosomal protein S7 [Candidatus Woesebacteria bacterium]|nr:30S ribosomal protein S7 [Candidatus Woesebacteria bacterium]QQG47772.1 MAG: 30S ribosomal protein S7 [Candidatus Woesebacteria bacterium]